MSFMNRLSDAKFNSITVLLAVLIPSGITYLASNNQQQIAPDKPSQNGCGFQKITGHIDGSPNHRWEFDANLATNEYVQKIVTSGATGNGTIRVSCSSDQLFLRRQGTFTSDGVQRPLTCFHWGKIDRNGNRVEGDFACKSSGEGQPGWFKWEATLVR